MHPVQHLLKLLPSGKAIHARTTRFEKQPLSFPKLSNCWEWSDTHPYPTPPSRAPYTLTKTRTQAHKYTHRDILYTVRPLPTCPVALVLLACTRATGHIALCILYRYLTQASICLLSICVQDCPLMLPFNCMCTLLCTFAVNVDIGLCNSPLHSSALSLSQLFSLPRRELTIWPSGPLPRSFSSETNIFKSGINSSLFAAKMLFLCWLFRGRNSSLISTVDFWGSSCCPLVSSSFFLSPFLLWFSSLFLYASSNEYGWPSAKWLVIHPQDNSVTVGEVSLTHVNRLICRVISSAGTLIWNYIFMLLAALAITGRLLAVFTLGRTWR